MFVAWQLEYLPNCELSFNIINRSWASELKRIFLVDSRIVSRRPFRRENLSIPRAHSTNRLCQDALTSPPADVQQLQRPISSTSSPTTPRWFENHFINWSRSPIFSFNFQRKNCSIVHPGSGLGSFETNNIFYLRAGVLKDSRLITS